VSFVRFEAFTAVTMKHVVFWDVALCRTWVNRHFGGTYLLLQQAAHTCSPLADYSTLKMEEIRSSEMSVNPSSTQRHIPKDNILQVFVCFLFLLLVTDQYIVSCCGSNKSRSVLRDFTSCHDRKILIFSLRQSVTETIK
jgi:hypothetical protein